MRISGLQKMTLLDFPGKVACTVFLPGCNYRCPFCHNSGLLDGTNDDEVAVDELLSFLKKRQGLLDGVCITGGEPTLQSDLDDLLRAIKDLGFEVKLDTNGSHPTLLKQLVADGLVDYVAMDVKNAPAAYPDTVGVAKPDLAAVEESLTFLLSGTVPYELRTTVTAELHTPELMEDIGAWLQRLSPDKKAERYFLQPYVDRDSVLQTGLHAPDKNAVDALLARIEPFVESAAVRGSD